MCLTGLVVRSGWDGGLGGAGGSREVRLGAAAGGGGSKPPLGDGPGQTLAGESYGATAC